MNIDNLWKAVWFVWTFLFVCLFVGFFVNHGRKKSAWFETCAYCIFADKFRSHLLSLLIQYHRDTWCSVDLKKSLIMVPPGCEMLVLSVHQFSCFLCVGFQHRRCEQGLLVLFYTWIWKHLIDNREYTPSQKRGTSCMTVLKPNILYLYQE